MRSSLHFRAIPALALLVISFATSLLAQGLDPQSALDHMTLAPSFHAELYASEPEIRQPVAACFDERGRLWVIEYLQYPNPAGLKPLEVDQYLRTKYDKVPEPPPKGPRGADRIKILEDTNGDGRADKVTTFVDGLNLASGLLVGRGGLYVGQAPYLLFYPDRNRDDVPDSDPEVLLSGFGLEDAHATVNSLAWGPDGWIYGAQGSTVTANIRGIGFQQGIWRYRPATDQFELFAEGGGNTWGLDFDRAGHAFGSSNGHFITFHMVQSAYYWKGFAKHGPLHNPHTYGYFDAIAYDGQKQGGHVTPGGIIYKGDQFPPEFQGRFLGANLLSNTVYSHDLKPQGSTFVGRFAGTLLDAHDPWFRPIDLLTGPEGAVYVVDWYDKRASHLDPRDTWDKTNGRIYRIVHGKAPLVPHFDLASKTDEELLAYRTHENDWWSDTARRILAERPETNVATQLSAFILEGRDQTLALRDLWTLYQLGGLDLDLADKLLDHPLPGIRRWVIRLLGDDHRMNSALRQKLAHLARSEQDPAVLSQLASSCQRWGMTDSLALLEPLAARDDQSNDPHFPLLLWWAYEHWLSEDPALVIAHFNNSRATLQQPLVKNVLLERLARALSDQNEPALLALAGPLLIAAAEADLAPTVIAGLDQGLQGVKDPQADAQLTAALDPFWNTDQPTSPALRLAARLKLPGASTRLDQALQNPATPAADRVELIRLLGQLAQPDQRDSLLALFLNTSEPISTRQAALDALAAYPGGDVAQPLLAVWPTLDPKLTARLIDFLCGRPQTARALVAALESGQVDTKALGPAQVMQVVRLGDAALITRLEQVWGRIPSSGSSQRAARIAQVRGILPEGDKGKAERGAPVFTQQCAGCHKLFGQGEAIGPDLTGAERGNLDFLLESLVDPGALVRKEYEAQTIALADGRVLSGLLVDETENTLTLFDSQRQRHLIVKSDIDESKTSDTSLMPDGLLDTLSDDQIRDLFKYLQGSGPAPSATR